LEPHGKKQYQKFSYEDLCFLKEVKALTDEGYLVSRAAQKVRKLRDQKNNTQSTAHSLS